MEIRTFARLPVLWPPWLLACASQIGCLPTGLSIRSEDKNKNLRRGRPRSGPHHGYDAAPNRQHPGDVHGALFASVAIRADPSPKGVHRIAIAIDFAADALLVRTPTKLCGDYM